jgi:cold shock CspA family protein
VSDKRYTGTVKLDLFSGRGYGFIAVDGDWEGSPRDLFVHQSAINSAGLAKPLQVGDRISFEIDVDQRSGRPKAANVRLAA